ncbi:universal stress protein [Paraherbaspirillum soli]|uniref:Universal stress protein n=1 Tax=Paraherbaspirillum soli TaxID=631222 RepID=A0ABW0MFT2_9BURK
MYRKILVAYNGTPESRSALHACIRLTPGPEIEIHLLGVINLATYLMTGEFVAESAIRAEKHLLEQELARGHKLLTDAGLHPIDHFESGEPVNVISDLVGKLGIELVIVGHSRKKPLAMRWWRGSVDSLLVEKVPCSILVATDPCG